MIPEVGSRLQIEIWHHTVSVTHVYSALRDQVDVIAGLTNGDDVVLGWEDDRLEIDDELEDELFFTAREEGLKVFNELFEERVDELELEFLWELVQEWMVGLDG